MGRVVGIISGKGGVGKTTMTCNLGATLTRDFNKKVIAVDTNVSTSSLALHLGVEYHPITINDILEGKEEINGAIIEHPSGLHVLPASISINDLFVRKEALPRLIDQLRDYYDIILLDTAPSIGDETLKALEACDDALIVTNPQMPAVVDALKLKKLAEKYDINITGLVLNKWEKQRKLQPDEIGYTFNESIKKIPRSELVQKSLEKQIPVVHAYPNSKVALSIKKIAANLIGEEFEEKVSLTEKLKRFFGL